MKKRRGEFLNSLYKIHIALLPKPDQDGTEKKN